MSTVVTSVGMINELSNIVVIEPSNSTNKVIGWISSDTSNATVCDNGIVIAKKAGKCKITAATQDGTNKSVMISLTVRPKDGTSSLYFKDKAYAEWQYLSRDRVNIHFQVTNMETAKTVQAFELCLYAEDTWGNRIYGSDKCYYWTTTKSVGGGRTVYSDYITIPDYSKIGTVYCGIHKVKYTDGTSATIGNVDYISWDIY